MSDAEWAVVRDAMPVPGWLEGRGGQPEGYCHRQLVDAVRYPVAGGGKKVNGRKRHIVVDTLGLVLVVMVTAASVTDRDAGQTLLPNCAIGTGASRGCGPTAAIPGAWSTSPVVSCASR
ncbi:transposase [Streptomyces sp. NPDC056713]|uniref:transposase n=1 Tax=Streptomyces sp. NPDC056713 TaxID=3345921 RepID=UPI0036A1696D